MLTVVRLPTRTVLETNQQFFKNLARMFREEIPARKGQVAPCRIKSSLVCPHVHLRQFSVGQLFSRLGLCYLNGKDFN